MGTFLDSFSKSTVEAALHASEMLLLVSGLVLLVGIWGEYRKEEKWKRYLAAFQIMVLAGIGVELLADAGVFLFSESLQRLEGADIQALDKKAREANDRAADALGKSRTAVDRSETADSASKAALDKSGEAEHSATSALNLAKGARNEADSFERDIKAAKQQATEAEAHLADALKRAADASRQAEQARIDLAKSLAPRVLTTTQARELVETLRTFPVAFDLYSYSDPESIRFMYVLRDILKSAGWTQVPALSTGGMRVGTTDPRISISGAIGLVISSAPSQLSEFSVVGKMLETLLSSDGIDTRFVADSEDSRGALHIQIGKKP